MLNIQQVGCQKKLVKCYCILHIFVCVYFVLLHIAYYNGDPLHDVCIIIDFKFSLYLNIIRREHLFLNFRPYCSILTIDCESNFEQTFFNLLYKWQVF